MKNQINSVSENVASIKRQIFLLNDQIVNLKHDDMGVKTFISRVGKLSLQSLDLFNEMERQLLFLSNEFRSHQLRKQNEDRRKRANEDRERRRKIKKERER